MRTIAGLKGRGERFRGETVIKKKNKQNKKNKTKRCGEETE